MTSIESRTTWSVALEDIFSSPNVMVARAPWMTQVCHAGTVGFSSSGAVLLITRFFVPQLTIIMAAQSNPMMCLLFTFHLLNMCFYLGARRSFLAVTQGAVEIKKCQLVLSLAV